MYRARISKMYSVLRYYLELKRYIIVVFAVI